MGCFAALDSGCYKHPGPCQCSKGAGFAIAQAEPQSSSEAAGGLTECPEEPLTGEASATFTKAQSVNSTNSHDSHTHPANLAAQEVHGITVPTVEAGPIIVTCTQLDMQGASASLAPETVQHTIRIQQGHTKCFVRVAQWSIMLDGGCSWKLHSQACGHHPPGSRCACGAVDVSKS
jgi:hypothetical protein